MPVRKPIRKRKTQVTKPFWQWYHPSHTVIGPTLRNRSVYEPSSNHMLHHLDQSVPSLQSVTLLGNGIMLDSPFLHPGIRFPLAAALGSGPSINGPSWWVSDHLVPSKPLIQPRNKCKIPVQ